MLVRISSELTGKTTYTVPRRSKAGNPSRLTLLFESADDNVLLPESILPAIEKRWHKSGTSQIRCRKFNHINAHFLAACHVRSCGWPPRRQG